MHTSFDFKTFCFAMMVFIPSVLNIAQAQRSLASKENHSLPFLINEYAKDLSDLKKVYLFNFSTESLNRFEQYQNDFLKKLDAINLNTLSISDQVDYTLLKRKIVEDQYELKKNKKLYTQIKYAVQFDDDIIHIQQKRRRGSTPDVSAIAAQLLKTISSIKDVQKLVEQKPLTTVEQKQMVATVINDLRKGLKNVHSFYNGYHPSYTFALKELYPQTDATLENYAKWINSKSIPQSTIKTDASGIVGNPIGRDELMRQLQYQMIPYTPEELIEMSKKEYAWCEAEMIKVSNQMGFGNHWKKALEQVKQNFLPKGEQPALINRLQEEAIHFIDSLQLVSIPSMARELWRMDMLSVQQMKFASYFLGGAEILIAYAHDDQDAETQKMIMRSGNYGFAHAEVFHELIPGHNLQYYMFSRYKPYRQAFNSPFSMEGWPLYWEMKLWNKGFDKTVDEKAGALFWRMTRCARIVFSLNYHLENWTPQQCIDYLVDKAGLEPFSAESEVRRSFTGGYGPLYQLAYMIGAFQLNGLYKEAVLSGKMIEKDFNDAYLREGPIPIEMLRAIILNKKIDKNFSSNWRFIKN
ncbi:MAG: DUF885 family protein [Chitinophagaceae bacterium]|nr:MAG: DUF885 family protein [Chitinophagaceae bacterium]